MAVNSLFHFAVSDVIFVSRLLIWVVMSLLCVLKLV